MSDESGERDREIGATLFDGELDLLDRAIKKRYGTLHRKKATFIREAVLYYSRMVLGELAPGEAPAEAAITEERAREVAREEFRAMLAGLVPQGPAERKKDSAE